MMGFWKWMSSASHSSVRHGGGIGGYHGRSDHRGWGHRESNGDAAAKRCLNCGVFGVAGAQFCQACGVSFILAACARCKAAVEAGARFCGQCGAPMA
jgi:RNA polymerase subunit RPABC4/transcription elongation factor Spt4